MKYLVILFILLQNFVSIGQTTTKKTINIDPKLSFQNYEHFTRLTLSSPDSPAEYITDFDFEWGYEYKLSVFETKLEEELSDGTQYDFVLDKIISKTKMPDSTEFKLFLEANRYYYELPEDEQDMNAAFVPLEDGVYRYMDAVEIEVPKDLQEAFNLIIDDNKPRQGRFQYVNGKRIRLIGF